MNLYEKELIDVGGHLIRKYYSTRFCSIYIGIMPNNTMTKTRVEKSGKQFAFTNEQLGQPAAEPRLKTALD